MKVKKQTFSDYFPAVPATILRKMVRKVYSQSYRPTKASTLYQQVRGYNYGYLTAKNLLRDAGLVRIDRMNRIHPVL